MQKVCEKVDANKVSFRYSDTNEEEIKFLFALLIFKALYQDTNGMIPLQHKTLTDLLCHYIDT